MVDKVGTEEPGMSYTVDAVSSAMNLLFVVAEHPGLGVTDLSKLSGITKARAFRFLNTLEQSGMIHRQEPAATYQLGYRALFLGMAAQGQVQLARLADMLLPGVVAACGESVMIRVREASETVCIAWSDAPNAVRVHTDISERRPLYVGASGKLLLAYAPKDVQEAVLRGERKRYTGNTITSAAQLRQAISKIRELGYSVSFAEKALDTVSVAAPIQDASGAVIASLAMTAPASRAPAEKLPTFIAILQNGARQFSQQLGYVSR
jgi:IclR family KDG regulon transcriptional repressor